MKLGLISAILGDLSFEEMIDFLAECGLECVEVACWPKGKAERRYAGVSHIDVDTLDDEKCAHILDYCQKKGVEISSLAYYPNTMDPDVEKRTAYIEHLHKLIDASAKLGVNMITTFIGRDPKKTVSQNLELVKGKTILVDQGRIQGITDEQFENSIDLHGDYVIPAFVNAHCHLGDTGAKELGVGLTLEEAVVYPNGLKHKYLAKIKNSEDGTFVDDFNMYSEKYSLNNI